MNNKPESFGFKHPEAKSPDRIQTPERLLEQLKNKLKQESELIRELGAPVDDEARIDMMAFSKIGKYDLKMVQNDLLKVADIEAGFREKDKNDPDSARKRTIGELFEVTKTILFNEYWFKENFVALRASKYDDYCNHVDEVIFDIKTHKPFAVIDTTTMLKDVKDLATKIGKFSGIKYGLAWESEDFKTRALNELPVFILHINKEQVEALANQILSEHLSYEGRTLRTTILQDLLNQSNGLSKFFPQKASEYKDAGKIFTDITSGVAAPIKNFRK